MNDTEQKIREHLNALAARTDRVKKAVEDGFWSDIVIDGKLKSAEAYRLFFEPIELQLEGRTVRAFRGFVDAGLRAVKRQAKEIVGAAQNGAEFAGQFNKEKS